MIVTFEGSPAVGKSTVANFMQNDKGCYVVPEVNKLFGKRTGSAYSNTWYLQKQVERWLLAKEREHLDQLCILDGDVFQPVWFNTCFWSENWGNLDDTVGFFKSALESKLVDLPDKYVLFYVDENTRVQREYSRCLGLGKTREYADQKVARYSQFSQFQMDYFSALNSEFPELVSFLESSDIARSTEQILHQTREVQYDSLEVLEYMTDWCRQYKLKASL
jgi:hypothetical protein